jgi:hypothetical protein
MWAGRIAFAIVLVVGWLGAHDPTARWMAVALKPDQVSHGAISFLLTLLLLASFQKAPLWLIGGAILGLGFALEGIQLLGFLSGDAQVKDLVSDIVGVAAVIVPAALGRLQGWRARGG